MGLKIKHSDFAQTRTLEVDDEGVVMSEGLGLTGKRRFGFDEIDAILLSPQGLLSVQSGRQIVKITTKPGDRKQQEVIDALVARAKAARS